MALSDNLMSKYSEHLSAYKSACEEQPDIKSFDSDLQQRTKKVIDSLTVQDKTVKLSQHTVHMEVSKHLLEVTQGVADFIISSSIDVRENKALRYMVDAYFDNIFETLKIFNNVAESVDSAQRGNDLIQTVVHEFKIELEEKNDCGKKKKYEKTLKKLKKFKAMGDPFDGQVLTTKFELIKKQQESLLEGVAEAKRKLDEEISNLETYSLIANLLLGAAFAVLAVASIALIATGVGAAEGIGALATLGPPLIAAGWSVVYASVEKKRDALEKELENLIKLKGIEESVENGIIINEKATNTVSTLVKGLEDMILFELKLVDQAIKIEENEEALRRVVEKLGEEAAKLTTEITELGVNLEKYSKLMVDAKNRVIAKIIRGDD